MNFNFNFKKGLFVYPDNLDKIKVNENNAIKIKTGDCFIQSYVESLCKKHNKEDREQIEKHAMYLYDEMFKNGYCSAEARYRIKDTIRSFNDPTLDINSFIVNHKEAFLDISVTEADEANADPVAFFGGTIQSSVNEIMDRFGKILSK